MLSAPINSRDRHCTILHGSGHSGSVYQSPVSNRLTGLRYAGTTSVAIRDSNDTKNNSSTNRSYGHNVEVLEKETKLLYHVKQMSFLDEHKKPNTLLPDSMAPYKRLHSTSSRIRVRGINLDHQGQEARRVFDMSAPISCGVPLFFLRHFF